MLLEPRFDGFFEELLEGVGFDAFELAFEGRSFESGGEVGANASSNG